MKYLYWVRSHIFLFSLSCIVLLGILLRFYKFSAPIADWHSWRQSDTAAVARNFVAFGFDPFRPRYDDLSNIQSGKDNLEGFRMVEFPLYQSIAFFVYNFSSFLSIEQALRFTNIIASAGIIVLVGFLGKQFSGNLAGICSAFLYAVLPYSFFYGRAILPEPLMVFLSLLAIVLAIEAEHQKGVATFFLLISSSIVAGLSLLVKPFAIFLLLPLSVLYLQIVWSLVFSTKVLIQQNIVTFRFILFSSLVFLLAFIVVGPLYIWRQWILNFPEGIPVSQWLFNEGNIRFKGAWFHWLFAERIGKLMLGYWGLSLVILGLLANTKKWIILYLLITGCLLYFIIIARGNVQHDYYQQLVMPIICIVAGLGSGLLIDQKKMIIQVRNVMLLSTILLFTCSFSWFEIRGFYWINRPEIVEAGIQADKILPKYAKIIAPYNGDTTFLYQTRRQGWPIGFEIEKKIAMGATHYVTVSPTDADGETKDLASRYTVLVRNDQYAIIDLTKPTVSSVK